MILVHSLPFYWGVETDAVDRSLLTRSTLHEVLPPFRQSERAIRIRVSHKHWLHVGLYRYDPIAGRWGMNTPVEEISTWRGPNVQAEDVGAESNGDDPAADEVRQVQ